MADPLEYDRTKKKKNHEPIHIYDNISNNNTN